MTIALLVLLLMGVAGLAWQAHVSAAALEKRLLGRLTNAETAMVLKMELIADDLTAGLLRLRDDAVTRISDIQQAEPRIVTVEVPVEVHTPAPSSTAVTPRPKRETVITFMDCDETDAIDSIVIDQLRRGLHIMRHGVKYVCVRGNNQDGWIYRQERA